jgi:cell division protein FtsB
MKRAVWITVAAMTLVGAFFLGVSPARTFIAQRHELSQSEQRLAILKAQNEKLSQRVDRLHTDAEIERLARERYNLVKPGEEAYALLPSPEDPAPAAPASRPPAPPKGKGFWSQVWDDVTFWS